MMTKLDAARDLLKQRDNLITILDKFHYEENGYVMYLTIYEAELLAEYLINNGIVTSEKEKE